MLPGQFTPNHLFFGIAPHTSLKLLLYRLAAKLEANLYLYYTETQVQRSAHLSMTDISVVGCKACCETHGFVQEDS
jgi:hypothetical protein